VIVVDSSVWISHLRGQHTEAVHKLQAFVNDDDSQILVGDLILLEVLQGARDEANAARIEHDLRIYRVVTMCDATFAVQAARNYRFLRERGVTVRKTIDMIIGTFCIAGGHGLLHDDRDFEPMATFLGLQVI
jgi:predicted nucleic acid-binding protein